MSDFNYKNISNWFRLQPDKVDEFHDIISRLGDNLITINAKEKDGEDFYQLVADIEIPNHYVNEDFDEVDWTLEENMADYLDDGDTFILYSIINDKIITGGAWAVNSNGDYTAISFHDFGYKVKETLGGDNLYLS